MKTDACLDARWLWLLLFSGSEGTLQEPACDYNGMLDRMEAAELLSCFPQWDTHFSS